MILYKNTDKYNLLNDSLFKLSGRPDEHRIYSVSEQFNWEELISNKFNRRHGSRSFETITGKGLIFIGSQTSLLGILCTPKGVVFNGENKNDLILLASDYWSGVYTQEVKRIKKMMNENGLSSRKQFKVISDDVLKSFSFDPLNPTMDKLSNDVMDETSKAFIRNCKGKLLLTNIFNG